MLGEDRPSGLTLADFQGDVDELLRLVGLKRVVPTDLVVADITRRYSDRIRGRSDELNLEEVGAFITASARLMHFKSAHLLVQPVDDAMDEEDAGVSRRGVRPLRYAELATQLSDREGFESFAPLAAPQIVDKMVEPRSASLLQRVWDEMQRRAEQPTLRVAVPSFLRLETAVSRLIRRLTAGATVSLTRLLAGSARNDAVIHFLAVLELVRRGQADAVQMGAFADITVEYVERGADEPARAG